MGACLSSTSNTQTDGELPTVHIISPTGDLRQYAVPISVSQVLLMMEFMQPSSSDSSSSSSSSSSSAFFVCNSDLLNSDEYIPAMAAEEQLQANQIYFVLPISKLQYCLTASDMAALAVKASVAFHKVSSSNSNNKSSSRSLFLRRRRNKTARISPAVEQINNQRVSNESNCNKMESTEGLILAAKKGFSDKPAGAPLSRSGSIRKLQRYSSKRAKMAVRSFRAKLTTIYEGSVLQIY